VLHHLLLPADGKTFKKPRRPFEKERLDAELKLVGEYGLRNKRELWRVQMVLSKIRNAARTLLTLEEKDAKRMFEGQVCYVTRHFCLVSICAVAFGMLQDGPLQVAGSSSSSGVRRQRTNGNSCSCTLQWQSYSCLNCCNKSSDSGCGFAQWCHSGTWAAAAAAVATTGSWLAQQLTSSRVQQAFVAMLA
jgi:hypothetical protein